MKIIYFLLVLGLAPIATKASEAGKLITVAENAYNRAVAQDSKDYFFELLRLGTPLNPTQLLVTAAAQNRLEIVRALLHRGADANSERARPLACAVLSGHLDVVAMLLAFGANPALLEKETLARLSPALLAGFSEQRRTLPNPPANMWQVQADIWQRPENERRNYVPAVGQELNLLLQMHNNSYAEAFDCLAREPRLAYLIPGLLDSAKKAHVLTHTLIAHIFRTACTNGNDELINGNYAAVEELLTCGLKPDVQVISDEMNFPLIYAVDAGNEKIVQLILTHPQTREMRTKLLRQKNSKGETALIRACSKRHGTLVDDIAYKSENAALATQKLERYVRIACILLDHGANIKDTDCDGCNAFVHAAFLDYKPLIDALRNHTRCKDLDLANDANAEGRTPLLLAAIEGNTYAFRNLLEAGARIKKRSDEQRRQREVGSWADVYVYGDVEDVDGNSAYLLAAKHGHAKIMRIIYNHLQQDHDEIRKTVGHKNLAQQCALHLGCINGHLDAVETYFEHHDIYGYYQQIYNLDEAGFSPLLLAAYNGHTSVIQAILGRINQKEQYALDSTVNFPFNARNIRYYNGRRVNSDYEVQYYSQMEKQKPEHQKNTALHYAAAGGHITTAMALCSYGAKKDLVNAAGLTPYDVAVKAGKMDVARYLAPAKKTDALKFLPSAASATSTYSSSNASHSSDSDDDSDDSQEKGKQKVDYE